MQASQKFKISAEGYSVVVRGGILYAVYGLIWDRKAKAGSGSCAQMSRCPRDCTCRRDGVIVGVQENVLCTRQAAGKTAAVCCRDEQQDAGEHAFFKCDSGDDGECPWRVGRGSYLKIMEGKSGRGRSWGSRVELLVKMLQKY